jgi:probable F420-dependent oxidoreductase
MKIGVNVTNFDDSLDVATIAERVEGLGFDSFWLPEHIAVPVKARSRYYGSPDGSIPQFMSHMVDPFIGLARASAVTRRIRLGTSICLVPEHNPLLLAKRISTLDHFSGGRFIFAIGTGWLREECELMGGDFDHRWSQAREAILAMKELWTKDEAEFHGKYYDFPPVRSYPKPAQKPHPPVILGGTADNVFKRVVAWGDGWMPSHATVDQIKAGRAVLDELAGAAGRDPASLEITAFIVPPDPEIIGRYQEAGAERVVLRLPPPSGQEALSQVEEFARRLRRLLA